MDRDCFYTAFCNFLNYTTSVFPVTFADKTLDGRVSPHQFYNKEDEAVYKLCKWHYTLPWRIKAHGFGLLLRR